MTICAATPLHTHSDLLTLERAAEDVHASPEAIEAAIHDGELNCRMVCGAVVIRRAELHAWANGKRIALMECDSCQ